MQLKRFNSDKALSKLSNKNNKKLKIGTIICSICLLVGAIIYFSFARFESTQTFHLIDGTVVDPGDVSLVSYMYDDGSGTVEKHNVPPTNNGDYVIDQVSCTNGNGTWNNTSWSITISSITGKVKCNLTFKKLAYKVISGNLSTVGSVVKIADEEFYVIGQEDSSHVKLLSKWNLNVGSKAKGTATNLQDSDVRGKDFVNYSNPYYGGILVTRTQTYIENYVDYLIEQGASVTGRLIKVEELITLGCDESSANNNNRYSCSSAPEWVYQTAYTIDSGAETSKVWRMWNTALYVNQSCSADCMDYYGVRPVIILEK